MMKILSTLFLGVFFTVQLNAQVKPQVTVKIKTPTTVCAECKKRIEDYLKRHDGVLLVNVNYKKGETSVKYLTDRINIEEIKTAIANRGYDADDVEANPDAVKKLPITCRPKPKSDTIPSKKIELPKH